MLRQFGACYHSRIKWLDYVGVVIAVLLIMIGDVLLFRYAGETVGGMLGILYAIVVAVAMLYAIDAVERRLLLRRVRTLNRGSRWLLVSQQNNRRITPR